MSDCVKKVVDLLENLISDYDDKVRELNYRKEQMEKVSRFVAYINDDIHLVGIYADQDLICDNLENIESNKDEYKACCYLIKNDDENIKKLPQYEKAVTYITNLINYFKQIKKDLSDEIQDLENVCKTKQIEKKYYEMFSSGDIYVDDVKEYETFLDEHKIKNSDKKELLILAIKNNVIKYKEEMKGINR